MLKSDNLTLLLAITEDIKKDRNKEYWSKGWQETWQFNDKNEEWTVTIAME